MSAPRVVTIDGPAGAGKSTTARRLAEHLGWRLLDTGAMYRAVALAALRHDVDPRDDIALNALAARITIRLEGSSISLDGDDISDAIRSIEVTRLTKLVAAHPGVRQRLVEAQREFAEANEPIVTEGRDQGTVVFPDAPLKIYLTASPEARARRRHAEFLARGESIALEDVLREMLQRDESDVGRAVGPLVPAADAVHLDTSDSDAESVVLRIAALVRERLG